MPQEYFLASRDFDRFMDDVKAVSMLPTHHQAYTMVEAVLKVFRSHVCLRDALRFADVLPPVIRAIFVSGWDSDSRVTPFPDRAELQREILAFRKDHNFSTPTAIEDVAVALGRNVDRAEFARALAALPAEAAAFWIHQGLDRVPDPR
jgi:uncharacterized protein (DUF2267 family)